MAGQALRAALGSEFCQQSSEGGRESQVRGVQDVACGYEFFRRSIEGGECHE